MFHVLVMLLAAVLAVELAFLIRWMWQRLSRAQIDKRLRDRRPG